MITRGNRVYRCPFCGHEIRHDAAFCRYCNRDLEDVDLLRSSTRVRRIAMTLAWLFAGLLILGAAAFVASLLR